MQKIVVFTGAGISAESGIKTFRDSNGLWEEYRIEDVATPDAWAKNPKLVLEFYDKRRKQILNASPNKAHEALVILESKYDVTIITQNIDDLHERAGSKKVIHLHGEIMKARSTKDQRLVYDLKKSTIDWGEVCEKGSQLRPHIVWFGELVPMMDLACSISQDCDMFITIGSSLIVYPAASLIEYAPHDSQKYLIDPGDFDSHKIRGVKHIKETAVVGVGKLVNELIGQ